MGFIALLERTVASLRGGAWRLLAALALTGIALSAQSAVDPGQAVYQQHCAQCHEGNVPRAPHNIMFRMSQPEEILYALTEGVMKQQAATLSAQQREQVANYLAGSDAADVDRSMPMCAGSPPVASPGQGLLGAWGFDERNHRFVDAETAGLRREDLARLELKWVFDFPGASRARSQPTVYGDVIFVGSQHGTVYAIDIDTGCVYWSFQADAEVRSAISIEPPVAGAPVVLYFGDVEGNIYSLDGARGVVRWRAHLEDHANATITGSPRLYGDRLFVPMSSREWATAADPHYPCCTFRGGIAAYNKDNGKLVWKSYSIPEQPVDTGKRNALGVPIIAPSGVPIWNSPTVDAARGLLYVGTGESYSSPAHRNSDAVLAFDLKTGELVWSQQLTANDAWNMSCFIGSSYNCPEENGPDMDIGAPPVLISLPSGKDILVVGQKNGTVYGLDPDNEGAIVWRRKVGLGGYAGGIHWGLATDGTTVYAPNADTDFIGRFKAERFPGVFALDAATGEQRWYTRAVEDCREQEKPACDAGVSAAATAVPGLVFAGGFDGQLRIYDSATGEVLWRYQTNREFNSVAGRQAHGGSIESDGPVVYRGNLLVNSGYLFGDRLPGNVLLNFAVSGSDDKEAQ
ncbi:dehydrogenase [Seongchinamella unica]|uniref:Dehydrogenase n=2 Tax=Seongchinamella unica TaxID=2547392 RepID=A0A4R5LTC3_9GAMM|nr:dehydrogenase [Seongchinamella unica]